MQNLDSVNFCTAFALLVTAATTTASLALWYIHEDVESARATGGRLSLSSAGGRLSLSSV
jgi:4-hydroxybenzoate polyprenyltransferase